MNRHVSLTLFVGVLLGAGELFAGVIPVTDKDVQNGLSPWNWVCRDDYVTSAICGASLTVGFKGTRQVSLLVDVGHIKKLAPTRYPIIAWSVNGGALRSHQLAEGRTKIVLASDAADPVVDLYVKGMSPYENRYAGDVGAAAMKITGFAVDEGGAARPLDLPGKFWLSIGDSIMSGDGAAYAAGQGRPHNDRWPEAGDGRASYGCLLARHYGCREGRIAYGGYNWPRGMAGVPGLATLIDQKTSTVSRLNGQALSPLPDVVLINLGENGVPKDATVIEALTKVRSRVGPKAKIIVMVPVSGRGRAEITRAFNEYKSSAKDATAHLVDLGPLKFATCDGQHPTAAGHEAIFKAAVGRLDAIVTGPSAR
ncbi:MAG: hypothetical protein BWX88_00767 [Planctomycetes bacterium ADurb.Bin126]|nr:MAG: hypothetical protein BWX88_00767 [Planctomycetes bacterium ADurb.Bin126]HOD82063.1 GDSL-type esterase/lipase family protein [Phycisphaerae bacterium]HQL72150.1 GDSL-type esterase/lipase family protein [Phycisphaerae bacterium]